MVDVIPTLRPRIKRSAIDVAISDLESSSSEDHHSAICWLDRHRFYLGQGECDRINVALKRIASERPEVGEIRVQWTEFSPHPDLDDSYFETDDARATST